jgi:hypothetical protein
MGIMKRYTIAILFFILYATNAQEIQWEKSYGGKQADYLTDAVATPDYGYILVGSSLSVKSGNKTADNKGDLDYWIWKMKENGDFEWQKSFGGSGADFLQSIALTSDAGYILAGTSASPGPSPSQPPRRGGEATDEVENYFDKKEACRGGDDFWIIKLDAAGSMLWQKTIGGSGQEKLQSIKQTRDGGYIIGGSSTSPSPFEGGELTTEELLDYGEKRSAGFGNMDYWIVKLDKQGKIVWQKTYGGIYYDELRSIEQTTDGGFIVGGYSNSPSSPPTPLQRRGGQNSFGKADDNIGIGDFWVIKIDQDGNEQWQRTIGGDQDDQLYVVHQTYDGNYVVGGNSNSPLTPEGGNGSKSIDGTDFWVLKLDKEGKTLWQETYNIGQVDILTSLVENKDHTLLLGGFAQSESSPPTPLQRRGGQKDDKGINDFVAIKTTESGEETWRKTVGSDGEDLLKKAIETRDGGYLLAGTSSPLAPKGGINGGVGNSNFGIDANQDNQQLQDAKNNVTSAIGDVKKDINNTIKEKTDTITNKINDALAPPSGAGGLLPFKLGVNSPTGGINLPSLDNGNSGKSDGNNNVNIQPDASVASGDRGTPPSGAGGADFWVVKIKDSSKPEVVKAKIEALPNPATTFTNVIVGYDYSNGTASVYDLAGRQLQSFAITSRTVPIDLNNLPEGIYIVNITTNVQSDGVKVIKSNDKK